jgi:hypothetical protein
MNRRPFAERLADAICTVCMVSAALYFLSHVLAAWMRGGFEVIK